MVAPSALPAPPKPASATTVAPSEFAYKLTIWDISAERVPRADDDSESDPYVRFVVQDQDGYMPSAVRTTVLKDEANPVWPDTLSLMLPVGWSGNKMKVCVWDHDHHSDHDHLGTATIAIERAEMPVTKTLILKGLPQAERGGYKFPNFRLSFTYTAVAQLNPLQRCLACFSKSALQKAQEEAAAAVLQASASKRKGVRGSKSTSVLLSVP